MNSIWKRTTVLFLVLAMTFGCLYFVYLHFRKPSSLIEGYLNSGKASEVDPSMKDNEVLERHLGGLGHCKMKLVHDAESDKKWESEGKCRILIGNYDYICVDIPLDSQQTGKGAESCLIQWDARDQKFHKVPSSVVDFSIESSYLYLVEAKVSVTYSPDREDGDSSWVEYGEVDVIERKQIPESKIVLAK